jgi:hypothetical protein
MFGVSSEALEISVRIYVLQEINTFQHQNL